MECQKCSSNRIAGVYGKCSDLCSVSINGYEHDGYVPGDMNIGGGDDIQFDLCLDCGQVQGEFPICETDVESKALEKREESEKNRNFNQDEFFA